jgi:hypothetical protein
LDTSFSFIVNILILTSWGLSLLFPKKSVICLVVGEAVKRDLKGWDIPRDLYLDRSAWKAAIDMQPD